MTTIIEEAWPSYQTKEYQDWLATSPYGRTRTCAMMNAVPKDEVPEVTRMLQGRAEFLFVTDLEENFYESFGPSWDSFVETLLFVAQIFNNLPNPASIPKACWDMVDPWIETGHWKLFAEQ